MDPSNGEVTPCAMLLTALLNSFYPRAGIDSPLILMHHRRLMSGADRLAAPVRSIAALRYKLLSSIKI